MNNDFRFIYKYKRNWLLFFLGITTFGTAVLFIVIPSSISLQVFNVLFFLFIGYLTILPFIRGFGLVIIENNTISLRKFSMVKKIKFNEIKEIKFNSDSIVVISDNLSIKIWSHLYDYNKLCKFLTLNLKNIAEPELKMPIEVFPDQSLKYFMAILFLGLYTSTILGIDQHNLDFYIFFGVCGFGLIASYVILWLIMPKKYIIDKKEIIIIYPLRKKYYSLNDLLRINCITISDSKGQRERKFIEIRFKDKKVFFIGVDDVNYPIKSLCKILKNEFNEKFFEKRTKPYW